ncbi:MAG: hypothetical protein M0Q00_02735 [Acholeplasmataceae bacterium]|nr:hypothetical protein [Acholeplasmataceae bacterium]
MTLIESEKYNPSLELVLK